MKSLFNLLFLLCIASLSSNAQQIRTTPTAQPLKIGESLPDMTFDHVVNFPQRAASLSELTKGKILIIDFFATWCGPCVASLPHLDSLQRKYKDRISILLVSEESPKVIEQYSRTKLANISLPIIASDKRLNNLFPHHLIPHDVIIDKGGTYIATTDPDDLKDKELDNLLQGSITGITPKQDNLSFDYRQPLLVNGNGGNDSNFVYRSILTHYIPGIGSGTSNGVDSNGYYYRTLNTNDYTVGLFITAFGKGVYSVINRKRLIVNLPDSATYFPVRPLAAYYKWATQNVYCYELIVPKALPADEFYNLMFDQLNHLFDIKGTKEMRLQDCWVIKKIDNGHELPKSKGGEKSGAHTGHLRNLKLKVLLNFLNAFRDIENVIDDTGITYPVDMELPFVEHNPPQRYPDIDEIRENLNRYGLDIQKEKRNVEILVISKK